MHRKTGSSKKRPTAFDYAILGVNPALIMCMVGSLTFFLVLVFYQSGFEYGLRLRFIFAMFVMATVCVARISIENGREYASMYAIPLGVVTFIALHRFVRFTGPLSGFSSLINGGLLAAIWWAAHQLTWDCTVLDESKDVEGRGLLETAGLESGRQDGHIDGQKNAADRPPDDEATSSHDELPRGAGWWARYVAKKRLPHNYGVSVVYFALAALPIFGIGQGFLRELGHRREALQLFWVYLASSLGLLMTTSLLSIRRYLRQRRLEMAPEMATIWLATGATLIVAVLALSLLLPRPAPEYSVTQIDWGAMAPTNLRTNRWGTFEGKQEDQGAATPQASPQGQSPQGQSPQGQSPQGQSPQGQSPQGQSPQGQSPQGQSPQGQSPQGQSPQGQSPQGQSPQGQSPQGQSPQTQSSDSANGSDRSRTDARTPSSNNGAARDSEDRPARRTATAKSQNPDASANSSANSRGNAWSSSTNPPRETTTRDSASTEDSRTGSPSRTSQAPMLPHMLGGIARLFTWLYYLGAAAIVLFFAWRYREQVRAYVRHIMAQLRALWALFRGTSPSDASLETPVAPEKPRALSFRDFRNPFQSGEHTKHAPSELVRYTFSAMEAWARDRGRGRLVQQTPLEFVQNLSLDFPEIAQHARVLCDLYCRLAYGDGGLPKGVLPALASCWQAMQRAEMETAV